MSGRLVAFWAPCSGSGVTTLCARVGAVLARVAPVAAVDLNLFEPTLAVAMDAMRQTPAPTCLDALLPLLRGRRLDNLAEHAPAVPGHEGYAVIPGPLHPLTALQVTEADIQVLLDLLLAQYPLVVADLGPTLDSVATWPVLERAGTVVWVVGGHYPARFHTRRYLPLCGQLGLTEERVRFVLNRTRPVSGGQVEDELDFRPAVTIPHAGALRDLEETGRLSMPGAAFAGAVAQLAGLLAPAAGGRQAGTARRWFGGKGAAHAQR